MGYLKFILTVIAGLLAILAFRPAATPPPVYAQTDDPAIFVEPGIVSLRKPDGSAQGQGKMMIDLRTGNVFGFPTANLAPYPMDPLNQTPAISRAVYLGKFDVDAIRNRR